MRRYSIFLLSLPVAAACVRLGLWQVSRLHQRQAWNAASRATQRLAPITLAPPPARLSPYRRVLARGAWDFDRQVIVAGRTFEGAPAVIVATPLRLADGHAVLVERGWAPSPGARQVDAAVLREADTVAVEGMIVSTGALGAAGREPTPGAWPKYVREADPAALAPLYPYALLPYVVRRTAQPGPTTTAVRGLRPVPPPELSDGPHLSYAIQWFAFALIALVGSVALYKREKGKGKRET